MAGYSGTSLLKKLGIKEDFLLYIRNAPDEYFNWLSPLPKGVVQKTRLSKNLDFVHIFITDQKIFEKEVLQATHYIKPNGMIWVSWPKKSAKVKTDVTENTIRDFILKHGLVDVKVCAIDETWSGLKLVIPLSKR